MSLTLLNFYIRILKVWKINKNLPSDGAVRGLIITEKQYEKMKIFLGDKSKNENAN